MPPAAPSAPPGPLHEGGTDGAPLIVTLLLAEDAQQRFDRLRAAHFPARPLHGGARGGAEEVFRLAAHVTLFHALPGEQLAAVGADLTAAAARPPFDVDVTGVRLLGRGVALDLAAPELDRLHRRLSAGWAPWLTAQDAQRLRAHVTVQNKVPPEQARALHAELSAGFTPERVGATGLGLWRYLGGPWEPVSRHLFGRG